MSETACAAFCKAWDDAAVPSVLVAMTDEAWRVREMAAKVVARNLVGDLLDDVVALHRVPVARVQQVASRAVAVLTVAGA